MFSRKPYHVWLPILLVCFATVAANAQSNYFFDQLRWLPDAVGTRERRDQVPANLWR